MISPHHVSVDGLDVGNDLPLAIIAGPCVMESRGHALECAHALAEMARELDVGLIYKASFDKANRTSLEGARGIGLDKALPIFAEIRERAGLPVITDVHEAEQCARVAEVVDFLQIPAFLCRQTDLLVAAARTGRPINVKKGQFLAPWDMANVVAKIRGAGNDRMMVCERGTSFGYNTLVSDFRSLPIMRGPAAGGVRCDAFGAAAGREGHRFGRPARVRAGARPRRGRRRRRRGVHRDPPRPRQGAQRRPERDSAETVAGHRRDAARTRSLRQGASGGDISKSRKAL